MPTSFFFDPKRWGLRKAQKFDASAPIVKMRCEGFSDVNKVVACAHEDLIALKGDEWRDVIFEKAPKRKKKQRKK